MASLFDFVVDPTPQSDWKPEAPPCLDGIHDIYLNFETTGLKWFDDDKPIAASLYAGDRTWYLPWGHFGGGNLDEAVVKRFFQEQVKHKRITNLNMRFDVHMAREWGVDLEVQHNEVSDVGHYAALLDDHRFHFNLDSLIFDYLHEEPLARLDESRMASYHAGEAAARSMYNVDAVRRLKEVMWPELDAQDLQRVRALEDKVIYVVCEMEKNGAPIDQELLAQWVPESQRQYEAKLWELAQQVGWACNPDSPTHMERLFQQLHLPIERTRTGRPSFTDAILKTHKHPSIQLARRISKLASLKSKFIDNTRVRQGKDGILRYALNQLRANKDDHAEAYEVGAVTGRFSSSEIVEGVGVNIQQRMKAAKQRVSFGYDEDDDSHDDEIFLVRKLHIAAKGMKLLASDMDQCQYRIFASYVNNPRVIQAYRENPDLKFHDFMAELIQPYAEMTYRQVKDLDFAYIFGAGLVKMALMLNHITVAQYEELRRTKQYDSPLLAKTKEVKRIYDRELPEASDLLKRASHLAKPGCDVGPRCRRNDRYHREGFPHRGYVRTVLGRRMRFPDGQRLHKAFNGVDQGTEADVMKQKLVELHEVRHKTGFVLRITNHDEVVGDIGDREGARMVDTLLNTQSFPQLRVPLTWSTAVGNNWAETGTLEDAFDGVAATRERQGITRWAPGQL